MTRVDVNQLLIHAFQDIFFNVREVVFPNLVVQLPQGGRQLFEKLGCADPVKKVTLNKVGNIQICKCLTRQDALKVIITGGNIWL